MFRAALALGAAIALVAAPTAHASTGKNAVSDSAEFSSQLVSYHSTQRSYHPGTPPVTWDASLAAGAQSWAETCVFEHSLGCSGPGCNPPGTYGENLFCADPLLSQQDAIEGAMESWYNEVTGYNFNQPGYNPNAGHFTQVVWKASVSIGCGFASCNGAPLVLPTYVVCRYLPAGNMDTTAAFKANVLPCVGTCKTVDYLPGFRHRKLASSSPLRNFTARVL